MKFAAFEGSVVVVPASVIAEIWRDPPRHRAVSLLEATDAVVPLGLRESQAVGRLLGVDGSRQIVDANVALTALAARPSRAAGGTCAIGDGGRGRPPVDVAIEAV